MCRVSNVSGLVRFTQTCDRLRRDLARRGHRATGLTKKARLDGGGG